MNAQQLRNSILQEAIEGRLVPQDPNDEPASALLERIREEKRRLVKEGKLKKKDLVETPISEDEKPFEIPEGWEWCRMQDVIQFINGRAYKKEELLDKGKYKVLRVGNFFTNDSWYYSDLELPEEKYCNKGDLLYAWSASFGPKIWEGEKTIFHYHIWNVKYSKSLLYREYLFYFFMADKNKIKSSTTGSTMIHVSMENMKPRLIPIPPLTEQKRIVAKIEELMPMVEEYGKAQEALDKLNTELPEKLKKSILQEAIEGRLVPQDPNDEPASVLLDKIRKEKARLVKEGKLKKKDLVETPISEDEIPFEIPESWEWVRLGNVSEIARGGSPRPIKEYLTESPDGLNWIKIGDTDKGGKYINSCKEKIKPEGLKKTRMVHPGDFLLTNSMSFGRPYITNIEGCIHDGWLMISPYAGAFDQSYLYYVLSSAFAHKQFNSKVAGAVVQNLNSDKVAEYLETNFSKLKGLKIEMKATTFKDKINNRLPGGNFDLCINGWGADYPDPTTFLSLLHKGNSNNYGKYDNAQFNTLMNKVQSETDVAKRYNLLVDAEKVAMQDYANIPLLDKGKSVLLAEYASGLVYHSFGVEYTFTYVELK